MVKMMSYPLVDFVSSNPTEEEWTGVVEHCEFNNDTAQIVNPEYNEVFKNWLIKHELPIKCYMVWVSW